MPKQQARIFWGPPPEIICTPPPKAFGTPADYIYFDLIVSYLIILTTKFVKLPILWSQISPCRPRKQILSNFFLGLSRRCHHAPAKASSNTPPDIYPPPQIFIHPPKRKYENPSPRLAFFLQKRPVRCLPYNKFFNFHSPGKIFRIYIKHIIAQNLMFFVFEIVTFLV